MDVEFLSVCCNGECFFFSVEEKVKFIDLVEVRGVILVVLKIFVYGFEGIGVNIGKVCMLLFKYLWIIY